MLKNGVGFAITTSGYLHIGAIKVRLPKDQYDRADFLRAIAVLCSAAIGDSVVNPEGKVVDSLDFWED